MLRGPTTLEYLLLEQSQDATAPVNPSKTTLVAIDTHFWDRIWWLAPKAAVGRHDLVSAHLPQLHRHLLRPMRVETLPTDRRCDPRVPSRPKCTRTGLRRRGP